LRVMVKFIDDTMGVTSLSTLAGFKLTNDQWMALEVEICNQVNWNMVYFCHSSKTSVRPPGYDSPTTTVVTPASEQDVNTFAHTPQNKRSVQQEIERCWDVQNSNFRALDLQKPGRLRNFWEPLAVKPSASPGNNFVSKADDVCSRKRERAITPPNSTSKSANPGTSGNNKRRSNSDQLQTLNPTWDKLAKARPTDNHADVPQIQQHVHERAHVHNSSLMHNHHVPSEGAYTGASSCIRRVELGPVAVHVSLHKDARHSTSSSGTYAFAGSRRNAYSDSHTSARNDSQVAVHFSHFASCDTTPTRSGGTSVSAPLPGIVNTHTNTSAVYQQYLEPAHHQTQNRNCGPPMHMAQCQHIQNSWLPPCYNSGNDTSTRDMPHVQLHPHKMLQLQVHQPYDAASLESNCVYTTHRPVPPYQCQHQHQHLNHQQQHQQHKQQHLQEKSRSNDRNHAQARSLQSQTSFLTMFRARCQSIVSSFNNRAPFVAAP